MPLDHPTFVTRELSSEEEQRIVALRMKILEAVWPLLADNSANSSDFLNTLTYLAAETVFQHATKRLDVIHMAHDCNSRVKTIALKLFDDWVADGSQLTTPVPTQH